MEKETKEVTAVHSPHDKGYKRELSRPEEFLHFLKKYVKAGWTSDLTAAQLRLCDKEFVDKDYEGREADLIYEVTETGGRQIYLFILQELQSTVDHTMIFRVLVYVVNNLLRFFLSVPKEERERKDFRLPVMIPIVFYNGTGKWTAVRSMQEYQQDGEKYGSHILNLEYYLIDLSHIEENYILSSNTLLDNIMYCDKCRQRENLTDALKTAYSRVEMLSGREQEEFDRWVRMILLSVCGDREAVLAEIVSRIGNGDEDMAFKHNMQRILEEERDEAIRQGKAEGRAEGKAEGRAEGKAETVVASVRKMMGRNMDAAEISDLTGQEAGYIARIALLIRERPEAEDLQIARLLLDNLNDS